MAFAWIHMDIHTHSLSCARRAHTHTHTNKQTHTHTHTRMLHGPSLLNPNKVRRLQATALCALCGAYKPQNINAHAHTHTHAHTYFILPPTYLPPPPTRHFNAAAPSISIIRPTPCICPHDCLEVPRALTPLQTLDFLCSRLTSRFICKFRHRPNLPSPTPWLASRQLNPIPSPLGSHYSSLAPSVAPTRMRHPAGSLHHFASLSHVTKWPRLIES
jgi:hypothetical protein